LSEGEIIGVAVGSSIGGLAGIALVASAIVIGLKWRKKAIVNELNGLGEEKHITPFGAVLESSNPQLVSVAV
jgi:hypothetical protein